MTDQVTDEQLSKWASNPSYFGTREFVRAVIAEVRASRTREAEQAAEIDRLKARGLCEACGMNHEVMRDGGWSELIAKHERLLAERDVLQQRIDKALARCDAADTDQTPRVMFVTLLDPRAIRAALTGAAESHGERPSGPGTPADPVQGGTVQHSGRESGPDA